MEVEKNDSELCYLWNEFREKAKRDKNESDVAQKVDAKRMKIHLIAGDDSVVKTGEVLMENKREDY